jgi:hypothetical protein
LGIFPDLNEGLVGVLRDCVFYRTTNLYGYRHATIFVFFNGISTAWTEEAGVTIEGCVIAYGPGVAIEIQSGGNSVDAARQYVNITGSDARSGGIATGSPTIITQMGYGNTTIPGNGCGIYSIEPGAANVGALSGNWDNLWIVNTSGPAIYDNVLGQGSHLFFNLSDSVIANTNSVSGGSCIFTGWEDTTAIHPSTVNFSNVTLITGNKLAAAPPADNTGAAINLISGGATYNVIVGRALGASNPNWAVQNAGPCIVNVDDSAFLEAGVYGLGTTPVTSNLGAGAINLTNVLAGDPKFLAAFDMSDQRFFAPSSLDYETAGPGGIPIDGGRVWTAPPAAAGGAWSLYQ